MLLNLICVVSTGKIGFTAALSLITGFEVFNLCRDMNHSNPKVGGVGGGGGKRFDVFLFFFFFFFQFLDRKQLNKL